MRKFLFTLLLLLFCHMGYGQNIKAIFNEFGSEKNADYVRVSPFIMSLGTIFCKHDEGGEMIRKIKSVKVMDLGDCSANVKERFNGRISKLDQRGYDELIRINDKGERIRLLMKTKMNVIREILFVCTGDGDCTLIQINGKFTKDDIDQLVNMETGKKNGCL